MDRGDGGESRVGHQESWPILDRGGQLDGMQRPCEVCAAAVPRCNLPAASGGAGRAAGRLLRFLVEGRVVALCDHHAAMFCAAGVDSLEGLRRLFPEVTGQRFLLPRRAALDRRVFPPRPEGRRLGGGRRAVDGRE